MFSLKWQSFIFNRPTLYYKVASKVELNYITLGNNSLAVGTNRDTDIAYYIYIQKIKVR